MTSYKDRAIARIEAIKDEYSYYSRDIGSNRIVFSFNCKYHTLKKELRDFFLSHTLQDKYIYETFIEDTFIEDLKENILPELNKKYDLEPSEFGFYGRSGGHFCITFQHSGIMYMTDYDDYEDVSEYLKTIKRMEKYFLELKEIFFNWWNSEVAFQKEQYEENNKEVMKNEIIQEQE